MRNVVGLLALWAAVACEGDPAPTAPELWCGGLCDALLRCGSTLGENRCIEDCIRLRPGLANISPEGAALLEPCLASMPCNAFNVDAIWKQEHEACWREAAGAIETTEAVRAFCTSFATKIFECGYSYDVVACEGNYAMRSVAFVERLSGCLVESSCEAFFDCADEVHGI